MRALASHQCGPGSNPGFNAICGLRLLLVLCPSPRGFSPGTPVFPSLQKPALPNSNSPRNKVDEEPLCGCSTSKSLFINSFISCFDIFADGCLSHLTGVAAGLLGVYLRWLLYPHEQQLNNQVKMEMKQYQDPQQISKEIYNSENIADIIAVKERQLQKSDKMPSEHLQKMRKAAMIENSEHQLLSGSREGSAFLPWSVVWLGSTVLVLSGILIKVFKGTLKNILIRTVVPGKKSKYVI